MALSIIFALSYNMLLGQTGLLSFGHAVYYGLGAYLTVHAVNWVITASALSDLAHDSGRRSAAAAERAVAASKAAQVIAGSVAEISTSIAGIAASVEEQAELNGRARNNSAFHAPYSTPPFAGLSRI